MEREKELLEIKKVMTDSIDYARCGLFDCRNLVNDPMTNIYKGKYFTLDICYQYEYFEVFGMTYEEFKDLYDFYKNLVLDILKEEE